MSGIESEQKIVRFDRAVSFLLEREDNKIRDGINDSELNKIIGVFKAGNSEEKIALAERASYYAEIAKTKRAEMNSEEKAHQRASNFNFSTPNDNSSEALQGQAYTAKLTGYYPADNAMEGGFVDRFGNKLYTLQDFLAGNAPYVSVAADKPLSRKNNQPFIRIPSIETKYGVKIPFKICDTGSAFFGKGTGRLDICTRSQSDSVKPEVNASRVEWYYDTVA